MSRQTTDVVDPDTVAPAPPPAGGASGPSPAGGASAPAPAGSTSAQTPQDAQVKLWARSLMRYRQPSTSRSLFELAVTAVPFVR